jgi:hypothetical protein
MDAGPLQSAAIPFQEEDELAFGKEVATPAIRDRSQLMRLGVRPPASALSNPVIEALIWDVSAGTGYPDEEGVRLDVVKHMKGAAARVLGTPDKRIGVCA